jgi:hypothetical protein
LKQRIREFVAAGDLESAAALVAQRKRGLGVLISLTYDADPLVCWRSIETMGLACAILARDDAGSVKEHMRRLNWLITEESGAICWRAPEAMAEIAARLPDLLDQYRSIVPSLLQEFAAEDLEHFRAGVLWGIGRLGKLVGSSVDDVLPDIEAALGLPDPQVRGLAAWALVRLGRGRLLENRRELESDPGAVQLYEARRLVETSVCEIVARMAV